MTDRFKDWVPVLPARGGAGDAARALLDIAGDPSLVRTDGNGTEFLVPAWVAERFTAGAPASEPPVRRRRAKKNEENA